MKNNNNVTNNTINAAVQAAMAAVAAPVATVNAEHATVNTVAQKKEVATMSNTMTKAQIRAALEAKGITMSDSKFKATKLVDLKAMLADTEQSTPVLTAESTGAPIDKVDVETLSQPQQPTQKPVKPVFSWKSYWKQNAPGMAATSFASAVNELMLIRGSQPTRLGEEFKKLSAMAHSFIKAKAGNGNVEFPKKFSVNSYTMNGKSFATCVFRVNGGAWYAIGIVYEVSKGYYKPVSYSYIRK